MDAPPLPSLGLPRLPLISSQASRIPRQVVQLRTLHLESLALTFLPSLIAGSDAVRECMRLSSSIALTLRGGCATEGLVDASLGSLALLQLQSILVPVIAGLKLDQDFMRIALRWWLLTR